MPDSKPNILVIWGDDIGITDLSCYSDGLMGYRTPNIDRIADEGIHRLVRGAELHGRTVVQSLARWRSTRPNRRDRLSVAGRHSAGGTG
jgi:hypothetical protein